MEKRKENLKKDESTPALMKPEASIESGHLYK